MNQLLPFYLYGTARWGEPLHWMIEHIATKIGTGKAPGTRLMVPGGEENPPYPYLVRIQGDEDTWGEVALLRRSHALKEFVSMEVNAGYSLVAIPVNHTLTSLPPFALAFAWEGDHGWLQPLGSPSWLLRNKEFAR